MRCGKLLADATMGVTARICIILSVALFGCSNDSIGPLPETGETFHIDPQTPTLFVGSTVALTPRSGEAPTGQLTWRSSDETVVTVDGNGLIKGIAPGEAAVRASTSSGHAETTVRVVKGGSTLTTSALTTCGIDTSSLLYCWGSNDRGQVGIGNSVSPQKTPARVGDRTFQTVSVGWEHACALASDGPYCWGLFTAWLIPLSAGNVNAAAPYKVDLGISVAQIGASGARQDAASVCSDQFCGSQTCVLSTAGDAGCWGATGFSPATLTFNPIVNIPSLKTLATGWDYGCGIALDGRLYCWGGNLSRQTAYPGTSSPVHRVADDKLFQSVSVGHSHTCALDLSGDAYCWGANSSRQLGEASTETCALRFVNVPCRPTPAMVATNLKFVAISVGTATPVTTEAQQLSHTCAITTDLDVVCWGANYAGQLGNGSTTDSPTPVKVSGNLKFRSIASGFAHTCAVTVDGDGYCWGLNSSGQLGTGSLNNSTTPVLIAGGLKFK